ncbi:MAG: AAA family ATPase, partial [Thermodesulfobacteriota bacterium]|nr:AAA family ATPase [Thermodesulfobacteriota bacterium]
MLADLTVKNFALIEELTVSFGPGFNVLTGETGAGKSIIVGAINLILGGRAASDLIRAGTDEAEVQAGFLLSHPEAVQHRLAKLGLPGGAELVIRRVLPRRGRNRIFINGALATLTQLSALGRDLIAVSGQHEHQRLLDPEQQILYLDQFGGLLSLRAGMGLAHETLAKLKAEVYRLEQRLQEAREKADLTQFQRREIEAAGLSPGEDEALEKEKELAGNAEKIFSLVGQSYDRLYGESGSAIETLDAVRADLERAAVMDERLADTSAQVQAAFHEIDDAAQVLRGHLDRLTFDPARLEEVEDRLALINRLKRKYGPLLENVLNYGREAAGRMERLDEMERVLDDRRSEAGEARQRAKAVALDILTAAPLRLALRSRATA